MHHLPSDTIRLLSSCQVINSVVNVVKELLENALDAKATSIEIKLDNYGFDKIEVQDNGNGIKATDAPVMGIKHYTSKITSHEDLEDLKTYGFRGEALGSICSVAEVHIATKTTADEISTQYVLDSNGHIVSQKPSHFGQGTTVTVLNLFKNLPVRKQYFSTTKKCKAELKKIQDLLIAYGIIKPDVRIVLVHNKVVIWQKNKVANHKIALMSVLGNSVMNNMVPFEHSCDDSEVTISGFLPMWNANRNLTSSTNLERSWIFINQRPVHLKEILKMVRLYYSQNTSSPCYPVFFMNIVLPASLVDVNVTPDKTQVMLQNKDFVLEAVQGLLKSLYPDPLQRKMVTEVELSSKDSEETECKNPVVNLDSLQETTVTENLELESQMTILTDPLIKPFIDSNNKRPQNAVEHFKYPSNHATTSVSECGKKPDHTESCANYNQLTELKNITSNDGLEAFDNEWSKGTSFKNSRGENLQPVKILSSSGENSSGEMSEEAVLLKGSGNTENKPTNVIFEKTGFKTALDLMGDQVVKQTSAIEMFAQKCQTKDCKKSPVLELDTISSDILDICEQREEENQRYGEEAAKDFQRSKTLKNTETKEQKPIEPKKRLRLISGQSLASKKSIKTPLSNQQILDTLFKSQAEKKESVPAVKTVQVTFSLSDLKRRYCSFPVKDMAETEEYSLSKLNFPGAWVVVSKCKISLLNPYRMEEALLYKRLVDSHKIDAETLDSPIYLTDRLLGTDYLAVLLGMRKDKPIPCGHVYFSDLRLTSNGFLIKIIPGSSDVDKHIEIEAMATSLPFYGISDLKEILHLVMEKKSKELSDCRPLKVLKYLEGEAVRLARQLPLNLSKDDVYDTVNRMKKYIGSENKGCIHGRPFLFNLADIPGGLRKGHFFMEQMFYHGSCRGLSVE